MGGLSAAKATLEPHGGEWLPRQGNGKGNFKRAVGAISEPLGDVFFQTLFLFQIDRKQLLLICFFISKACFVFLFGFLNQKLQLIISIGFFFFFKAQQEG